MSKRKNIRKIGAAAIASMLVVAMVIGLIPSETVEAARVSDYSTDTKYTESLGDNASTEYSGRIWSDKSVYSEKATFDLYTPAGEEQKTATVEKDDDSDFLVAFSALGSSEAISGSTQAPVDVVFVIDTSGSMRDAMSSTDSTKRITNTVKALNDAIEAIMDMNDYTRVAVVAFSNTAQELLPLGRYTKGTRTYQTGGKNSVTVTVNDYFSLQENTLYKHVLPEGSERQSNSNRSVTGGTNIQMGIYTGMNILASEENTTANIEGSEVKRVPSMILLSDGAPTYSSSSSSWWSPTNNNNDGPGGSPYVGNGMKALMTGAYMKERVDANYGVDSTVYTIGMGIKGLSNYENYYGYSYYTGEQDLSYVTLDPAEHWEDNNNMANAMESAWNTYTRNNGTPTLKTDDSETFTFGHPTANDIDDLDNEDASIHPLKQFVDDYYDADSASEVTDVFDEIVTNISISTPQVPTEIKGSDPMTDGYITYTDPIGEYMEVKDVKEIIYAGDEYKVKTKTQKETEDKIVYTYTFTGGTQSCIWRPGTEKYHY